MARKNSVKRLKTEFVNQYLLDKNIRWLDSIYQNNRTTLNLCCVVEGCGHIWNNTFHNLKDQNQGCPKCARKAKHLIIDVYNYLISRNINLLSKIYKNAHSVLDLECCKCKFQWKATYNDLKNKLSGCSECSNRIKYTIEYVISYLKLHNIILKSKKYINNKQTLDLECSICGFIWHTSFLHIYKNPLCTRCNKFLNEHLIYSYLRDLGIYNIIPQFKIIAPVNKSDEIFVDYYVYYNNKAYIIEYNGIQHYEFIKLFHKDKLNFEKQIYRDLWLKDFCSKNDITLISIDGRKFKKEKIFNLLKSIFNKG